MKKINFLLFISVVFILSCGTEKKESTDNDFVKLDTLVSVKNFTDTIEGKAVSLYTIKNENGMTVKITNFGAAVVSVLVPDSLGQYADVALGYPSLEGYQNDKMFQGATIGRYANRIAKGAFQIDGTNYQVPLNDGPNALHGGPKGFNKVVWDVVSATDKEIKLQYFSKDMEEGFPGNLEVNLTYKISDNNELIMDYSATTDKKTIINLTNHTYFNLSGEGSGSILDHELTIFADQITPVDSTLIPTGEFMDINGTPFDFRTAHSIGSRINENHPQLVMGGGYDHNWILRQGDDSLKQAISVTDPVSGRSLDISTTEPGIQFYSGNFMNGSVTGKCGKPYAYRNAFALEPQIFPDSPNQTEFPSAILEPGETYHQLNIYHFYNH